MKSLPAPSIARQSGRSAAWLVALVLVFWAAQLHGLAHGVTHLGDRAVPHAVVCADCVASVSAGAAPPSALPVPVLPAAAVPAYVEPVARTRAERPASAYRSRAPPTTLT